MNQSEPTNKGPLEGVRIIDMTTVLMGPYATQTLGDYGADVIKVESPEGDLVRTIGPLRNPGMGPIFLNANRSKRSITLDLKQDEGREALLKLCANADILVYNIRANAMKRLGLSYEVVSAVNPRIIYAGMFGYGQEGPYAAKPAYDDLIQGASTLPHLFTRVDGGEPRYVPSAIADRVVGLAAVGAILATLVHRDRTGKGQRVDIPMFETMTSFTLGDHMGGLTYEPPLDNGGYPRQLSKYRRPYKTKDGYVCALVYTDKHWNHFFKAIGREDIPETDPLFKDFSSRAKDFDAVYKWFSGMMETRSTAEWLEILNKADIPVMPMHDLNSIQSDPHLIATNFFRHQNHPTEGDILSMAVPATWSDSSAEPIRPAPRQGEHSIELLQEAGYTKQQIDEMLKQKVIQSPEDITRQYKVEN
ncbi:MAG: CoA transferase [Gammaproteobacteria bacterium]|nr:MAG: CoA transferase [Gammaproteobacteria bacterium]